jgi:hypothetical protein
MYVCICFCMEICSVSRPCAPSNMYVCTYVFSVNLSGTSWNMHVCMYVCMYVSVSIYTIHLDLNPIFMYHIYICAPSIFMYHLYLFTIYVYVLSTLLRGAHISSMCICMYVCIFVCMYAHADIQIMDITVKRAYRHIHAHTCHSLDLSVGFIHVCMFIYLNA